MSPLFDQYVLCIWICINIQTTSLTHSHSLTPSVTHTHTQSHTHNLTCTVIYTCNVVSERRTGHIRLAPSSSCSLQGSGTCGERRPSPAAHWSSQKGTWPLQDTRATLNPCAMSLQSTETEKHQHIYKATHLQWEPEDQS